MKALITRSSTLTRLVGCGALLAALSMAGLGARIPAAAAQHAGTGAAGVSALPCIPAGHGAGTIPSITFGRVGGNIRPMQVAIYGDGTINYQGAATPLTTTYTILPTAVLGLQQLAQAMGFWHMPALITSTSHLPDVASLFITVRAGCATTTHRVEAQGGGAQTSGFEVLYDTLQAATALSATTPNTPPAGSTGNASGQDAPAIGGPSEVTPAEDAHTLEYVVGQSFLLNLGAGYKWDVQVDNPAVLHRQVNVTVVRGAQGIYAAVGPGKATLIANGRVVCAPGTMCPNLVRHFQVQLVVLPLS